MNNGEEKGSGVRGQGSGNQEPKKGREWTEEQLRGIETRGRSLLVSAAAGSGKTAVLSERCARLICDPATQCNVDELLVVTFTENAAAEMKSRIGDTLREKLTEGTSEHLERQLALIDRAQVCTLDGFCMRMVKKYFHLLGLDPGFGIIDPDEAGLMRKEVARELFHETYEADESGDFQRLIDYYGDGNDERVIEQVIRTHEMLCSVVEPGEWRRRAMERVVEGCEKRMEESELGKTFLGIVEEKIKGLRGRCEIAATRLAEMEGFGKYHAYVKELGIVLAEWERTLRERGLDALAAEVGKYEMPKLTPMPANTIGKELALAEVDSVREGMKKGALRDSLEFTSAQWREGLGGIRPYVEMFLGLVEEFSRRYGEAKKAAHGLDFGDVERLALEVLREGKGLRPSAVARLCHREFRYVLVDEYQDINEVQDAILSLVSRECVKDEEDVETNLFCVGDVKQSIYRFRLAEPGRFLERYERFKDDPRRERGEVIDLQKNFRSRGLLLEAINSVFKHIMTAEGAEIEYDASHELREGVKYPTGEDETWFRGGPIEMHLLPDELEEENEEDGEGAEGTEELERAQREAVFIARRIGELMGANGGKRMQVMERQEGKLAPRPIRYSDIVILLRAMKSKADDYADILRQSGIPVHSASGSGYFESIEVRDMISLLNVLDNPRQDIPLAAVLRSPLSGLAEVEDSLARIRMAYSDRANPVPFHQAAVKYGQEKEDELAAHLRDFWGKISKWRQEARTRPLAELIWTIYNETGYLAFCSGLLDGQQRCANLIYLYERARQFGSFQRQGLYRFMRFLESLQDESDMGQPSVATAADDVVRIMSVHASKGMEYPVVFLPDMGKRFNLGDCAGSILVDRKEYLGMQVADEVRRVRYPSLAWVLVRDRLKAQSLAEEMRVLYVAMTRAKEHLILVGTCKEGTAGKWKSRWSQHAGALPADVILSGRTMLDWIGPAAMVIGATDTMERVCVTTHEAAEVRTWPSPEELRPKATKKQERLADMLPLEIAPEVNEVATRVIENLTYRYPYGEYSKLRAVQSVTALAKGNELVKGWMEDSAKIKDAIEKVTAEMTLEEPRCVRMEEAKASAADKGTATHLVLQYLDYERLADDVELARQVNELVSRKMIAPGHAAAIEFDAIRWMMESEAGELLRAHAKEVRRELPVYFSVEAGEFGVERTSDAGMDRVMVRGRLDALVPTEEGFVLMDYKTDNVRGGKLAERAEAYRPQMERYRDAIEKITGKKVCGMYLVFLTARKVWKL